MEIRIELTRDSYNSCPCDSLIITEGAAEIHIKIENSDREVSVKKSELKRVMRYLIEE